MDTLYVLPLKIVTTQILFLIVAIAVEAIIIQRQMQYPPRKSIEFAASLNLLSTVVGWLFFFAGPFLLPSTLQLQIINYVALGEWDTMLVTWLIPVFFITFFGTIGIEWLGFIMLQRFLSDTPFLNTANLTVGRKMFFQAVAVRPRQTKSGVSQPDVLQAIISGNSVSYGVILILLVALQVPRVIDTVAAVQ